VAPVGWCTTKTGCGTCKLQSREWVQKARGICLLMHCGHKRTALAAAITQDAVEAWHAHNTTLVHGTLLGEGAWRVPLCRQPSRERNSQTQRKTQIVEGANLLQAFTGTQFSSTTENSNLQIVFELRETHFKFFECSTCF